MRFHKCVSLVFLFLLQISSSAQTTLEKELSKVKNHPGINLKFLDNDKISIDYYGRNTKVFNLGSYNDLQPDSVPKFVFNIWSMDTTLFNYKFRFDQEMDIGTTRLPPLLGDINNNVKIEYYGIKKGYYDSDYSEVYCYEQNQTGIFQEVYKYPANTFLSANIYDIDKDGELELQLLAHHEDSISHYSVHDQTFYKKPASDSIASKFFFDYNIYQGGGNYIQLENFSYGDFNKDSITDAIFYNTSPKEIHVVEFNKSLLTFDFLLNYSTVKDEEIVGFTINDFDLDSKTDIIYASEYGNIYVLENDSIDQYSLNWQGNSGVHNSYVNFKTNDIDKNGRPEFWIGGQDFSIGFTRLVCYETDGNNSYHAKAEIEFPGVCSVFGLSGMSIDVDNDDTEELFVRNGNIVAVVKFMGTADNPDYHLYYFKNFSDTTAADSCILVENATISQFPQENYPSIIISATVYKNMRSRLLSYVYKHYLITDIKEELPVSVDNYILYNNFPNPFNPSTTIKFSIPERSEVKIKVFNSLGEEIITLINNTLERGEHTIVWNGKNKNNYSVPSGVYFISMEAKSFHKTNKCILIK